MTLCARSRSLALTGIFLAVTILAEFQNASSGSGTHSVLEEHCQLGGSHYCEHELVVTQK